MVQVNTLSWSEDLAAANTGAAVGEGQQPLTGEVMVLAVAGAPSHVRLGVVVIGGHPLFGLDLQGFGSSFRILFERASKLNVPF